MRRASIIINNFEYAHYLAESIDSALSQTYPNVEVIVVDDGSKDNSRSIIELYGNRVTALLRENGGQTNAVNASFPHASGDFILILDADDVLEKEAVATAMAAFEAHPEASKFQFPLRVIDDNGKATGVMNPRAKLDSGNVVPLLLRSGHYISPPTSGNFYPRWVLEKIMPVPETIWRHCDAYLNTLAPFHGPVVSSEAPLGRYRVHGNSMSSVGNLNIGKIRTLIGDFEKQVDLLETYCQQNAIPFSRLCCPHWTHGKLLLAERKMTHGNVLKVALNLVRSLWASPGELSLVTQVGLSCWAAAVVLLPAPMVNRILRLGFSRPRFPSIRLPGFVHRSREKYHSS